MKTLQKYRGVLSKQFVLMVLLFSIVSVSLTSLLSLGQDFTAGKQTRRKTVEAIEENWLPLLSRAVWLLSDEDIELIILAITERPEVESLALDIDGHFGYRIGEPAEHHSRAYSWPLSYSREGTAVEIGALTITVHEPSILEWAARFIPANLPAEILKMLLVLLPVFVLVQVAITKQLVRLTNALNMKQSRAAEEGLEELRLERKKLFREEDEFDLLVDAYNRLIRELRKDHRELVRREEALTGSLKDKEILLREVHHRVKNNLQVVISLIHLQSSRLEEGTGRQVLLEAERRMTSLALVHEQLYHRDSIESIEIRVYIQTLLNNLVSSMSDSTVNSVAVSVQGDEMRLSLDRAIPLALMMNELCTNAIEHAFDGSREGIITVSIERSGEMFSVALCDNGRGLPVSFSLDRPSGFGLSLVRSLAEQLDARLIHSRGEGGGACFIITAPED